MAYKPRLPQFKQGHCDGRTSRTALCRVVVRIKRKATQGADLFLDQFSTVYAMSEDITIVHGMNRWLDPQWFALCFRIHAHCQQPLSFYIHSGLATYSERTGIVWR
jgi:hypothetical protein